MQIDTVTVIGANGTMGCNIAGIFASFGNAKVYMVCRNPSDAQEAYQRAALSVRAEAIGRNLIPKGYDDLDACIAESDFIMECVAEDLEVKKALYRRISSSIPKRAIVASGTSGLSINTLAEELDKERRRQFFGVHFFNPPYSITLCEFIPSQYADKTQAHLLKLYLRDVLHRNVVEVKDTAAFMGNRIGFQFINLALQFAEKYKYSGGIDYIDTIMGGFTGRAMAPLTTSDFVGLDVHQAIVKNIYENTCDYEHNSFVLPAFVQEMIREKRLGRKSGAGLYKLVRHSGGAKEIYVYDIETQEYRPKRKYSFPFAEHMIFHLRNGNYEMAFRVLVNNHSPEAEICLELLVRYVLYSLYVSRTVGEDIHSSDKVMASGFNWAPPLCVYNALQLAENFERLADRILPAELKNLLDMNEILVDIPSSEYDFRPYFKAKG